LCWLALLLIRITETTYQGTWPSLRRELDRIALGAPSPAPPGPSASAPSSPRAQRDILAQLRIEPPPRIYQLTTETP